MLLIFKAMRIQEAREIRSVKELLLAYGIISMKF